MAYGDFATAVGETVGAARRSRWGSIVSARFGTVTKINGHGHIYVDMGNETLVFTRRGDSYKNQWGPNLMFAAQLRTELATEERRREQVRVAREMEQTLLKGYSHSGRFFTSAERVTALKNLVAEMEALVDA